MFCALPLQVGDYVKVEADRGEDLGMVVHIFPMPEAGRPLPVTAGQKRGFGQFEKEHIIRAATEDEVRPRTRKTVYCFLLGLLGFFGLFWTFFGLSVGFGLWIVVFGL